MEYLELGGIMKEEKNYFKILNSINVSDKTEQKNGLTYLSGSLVKSEYSA